MGPNMHTQGRQKILSSEVDERTRSCHVVFYTRSGVFPAAGVRSSRAFAVSWRGRLQLAPISRIPNNGK